RKMSAVNACRDVLDETVFVTMRRWLQPKQSSHIVTGVLRDLLRRERGASVATSHAVRLLLASKDTRVLAAAHTYLLREDAKHEKQLADLSKKEPAVFWVVRDLLPSDGRYSDAIVAVIVSALLAPRSDRDVNQLAQLLKKHSQAQLGSALRELIGHEKEDIRAAALRQLSTLTGGLRAKDLLKLLRSDAVVARLIAADTMRRRDDPSGLEVVLQAVPTAGKHKVEALRVLGRFRSRKSIPLLLGMLDDTDVQVRNAAWRGVQETMRSLFPYRSFDFRKAGYDPQGDSGGQARPAGIERIRAWWASVK
ncbi:MAG: HEAT repeat protein, partial [Planctomycetota bacterium]